MDEPKYSFLGLQMTMANVITLLRLPLLAIVTLLIYFPGYITSPLAFVLLVALFLMDWLDGYVARRRNETTNLGSILDIAVDRAVENILWLTFIAVNLVPLWIGVVYLIRSFVVDGLRSYAQSRGQNAFAMMHSKLGKFLVASRFMRALYGLTKGFAFGSLIVFQFLTFAGSLVPEFYVNSSQLIAFTSVYLSVVLCVLRGVPVLADIRTLLKEES